MQAADPDGREISARIDGAEQFTGIAAKVADGQRYGQLLIFNMPPRR